MNTKEIWKAVVGYESYYEVSNLGNVRSLGRIITYQGKTKPITITFKAKILKIHSHRNGYCITDLKINKIRKTTYIHRLVAEAFIPNPENKPTVNHIDGNKLNNNVLNLEWTTYSENNKHAFNIGLKKPTSVFGINNPKSKAVEQYTCDNILIKTFSSISEAARSCHIKPSGISAFLRGKQKTAGGFVWKYKNIHNTTD